MICRFGPYFCQPVIAGLGDNNEPFICTMDCLGAKYVSTILLFFFFIFTHLCCFLVFSFLFFFMRNQVILDFTLRRNKHPIWLLFTPTSLSNWDRFSFSKFLIDELLYIMLQFLLPIVIGSISPNLKLFWTSVHYILVNIFTPTTPINWDRLFSKFPIDWTTVHCLFNLYATTAHIFL